MEIESSIGLESVRFPVLVIADDGWVDYIDSPEQLSAWTYSAIRKYSKRRVMLYDSGENGWILNKLEPSNPCSLLGKCLASIANRQVPARLFVRSLSETPLEKAKELLYVAIDQDDDILTQYNPANEIKDDVAKAYSFESLVEALKSKGAILAD